MSYNRKLEIGHWNQGKSCKGSRKAKMRAFTNVEIDEQIAEQDEAYRTQHVSKRKPNFEARLRHRIKWYEQRVAEYERQVKLHKKHWSCSYASYAIHALREARLELKEFLEKKKNVRP